jgi:hypothetical protein
MDDETLAPMADALSATLAVIVLLICFFILAQIVAVSKQIEVHEIGEEQYMKQDLKLEFKETSIKNGELHFFKSFNASQDKEIVAEYVAMAREACGGCTSFKVISNYPLANSSVERSQRRALSNAIKMVPFVVRGGADYELELSNSLNYYFLKLEPMRQ